MELVIIIFSKTNQIQENYHCIYSYVKSRAKKGTKIEEELFGKDQEEERSGAGMDTRTRV